MRRITPNTCITGCLIATLAIGGAAGAAEIIPRSDFFAGPEFDMRVGPDGKWVLFGKSSFGAPVLNRIGEFPNLSNEFELTFGDRGRITACQWSLHPDFVLVSRMVDRKPAVYAFDASTKSANRLSRVEARETRVAHLSPRHPTEVLLRIDGENGSESVYERVRLRDGHVLSSISLPNFDAVYFDESFAPRIATRRRDDFGVDVLLRNRRQWEPIRVLSVDETNVDGRPHQGVKAVLGVDVSGRTLYLVDNANRDTSALIAVDLPTNAESILVEDPHADILSNVLMSPATGEPVVAYAHFDTLRPYGLTDAARRVLAQGLARFGVPVEITSASPDLSTMIVAPADGKPIRRYVYVVEEDAFTPTPPDFPSMNDYSFGRRISHVVETRDGLRLPCHVYLPPGVELDEDGIPESPLPAIFYVHGGPSSVTPWDGWEGRAVRCQQLLANRGYAAVRVEFRGTGGLGNRIREAGHGEWGRNALNDLEDVANRMVELGIADGERLGIWGFSYGGHAALAALTLKPDLFACGMSWSGVASLPKRIELHAETPFADLVAREIGDLESAEGRAQLRAQSALDNVESLNASALLFHGGRDSLPHEDHSTAFARRAEGLGKVVTYLFFPHESHSFSLSANWVTVWAVTEHFFSKHLGGQAEPYGDDLNRGRAFNIEIGGDRIPGLAEALRN